MKKYILFIIILYSCNNKSSQKDIPINVIPDSTKKEPHKDGSFILSTMTSADSVIVTSHYTSFEMEEADKTNESPEFDIVQKGELNKYMIREYKKLSPATLKDLSNILGNSTTIDTIKLNCFEPRNGIFLYKKGKVTSYIDICFECYNFYAEGNWGADFYIDRSKYETLISFYKKLGFKYGVDW